MSFLRTRFFAVLFTLLVLGGYGYQVYAHAMPRPESSGEHRDANSNDKGCHHCTCHCTPPIVEIVERVIPFQQPTFAGYAPTRGTCAPESMPLGIDHPPQLA